MVENEMDDIGSTEILSVLASVTILRGLVVGLPGARRRALEIVLDDLEVELKNLGQTVGYEMEKTRRLWEENEEHCVKLETKGREIAELHCRIDELESQVRTWKVEVRASLLWDKKIQCIKTLRIAKPEMGLLEAKNAIEGFMEGNGWNDSFVTIARGVLRVNADALSSSFTDLGADMRITEETR